MLRLIILLSSLSHTIRKFRCDLLSIQYGNLLTLGHPVYFGDDDDGDFFCDADEGHWKQRTSHGRQLRLRTERQRNFAN